jgi:hypothetical protein
MLNANVHNPFLAKVASNCSSQQSSPISSVRWLPEILDRRTQLMAKNFNNQVALLLVNFDQRQAAMSSEDRDQLDAVMMNRIQDVMPNKKHSIMRLDDRTYAVLMAGEANIAKFQSIANQILRICATPIHFNTKSFDFCVKGGLSTPISPKTQASSLISFSRYALTLAKDYQVAIYPDEKRYRY